MRLNNTAFPVLASIDLLSIIGSYRSNRADIETDLLLIGQLLIRRSFCRRCGQYC